MIKFYVYFNSFNGIVFLQKCFYMYSLQILLYGRYLRIICKTRRIIFLQNERNTLIITEFMLRNFAVLPIGRIKILYGTINANTELSKSGCNIIVLWNEEHSVFIVGTYVQKHQRPKTFDYNKLYNLHFIFVLRSLEVLSYVSLTRLMTFMKDKCRNKKENKRRTILALQLSSGDLCTMVKKNKLFEMKLKSKR